jgi:WD40 repeat protein/class 3 adenylate cyclase
MATKNNHIELPSKTQNPFVAGLPVKGEDFFGRKDILGEVILFLEKPSEVSFLIYGQRRVGKTSLLWKIQAEPAVLELACPVYYNLQAAYHTPLNQLLFDIADNIGMQTRLGLDLKKESFTGADPFDYRYFRDIFIPMVMDKLPANRSLLLLFDETDVMVPSEKEKNDPNAAAFASMTFIPFFAGLIEDIRHKKYPVKFILAIGREYKDPGQKQFNLLAKSGSQVEISYFTREETELLLETLAGPYIPFEEDAVNAVYAITAGQPFFTQGLAGASFDAAEKNKQKFITPGIVKQQVTAAIKSYSSGVYWVWDTLSIDDQVLLYLIALMREENKPINLKTIKEKAAGLNLETPTQNLPQTLKRLISYKFLKKTHRPADEYDFKVEFFRRWIVTEVSEADFARAKKDREKVKRALDRVKFENKDGVIFLADVINYTAQSNRLGAHKTSKFIKNLERKVRELTETYRGTFIKRIGDAILLFFDDKEQFLEFVIELREMSQTRCLDHYDFFADLRMVAHYGNFSFETIEEKITDLIGPEGIKVFRIEKYAGEYDVIITGSLLGVIRNALDEKNISFSKLGSVKLKGFDEDAFLYKLNFPLKGEKTASTLLCVKMEALEADTRVIPVFGDLYPAMNMENNFINLDIKTGDEEKWSGKGKYFPMREMEMDGQEIEEMPGIDLRMEREREKERPGYVDVKTLYNIHHHGIILGLPGSGKTTILKYFAFREFKENRKILEEDKKRVALFIPCRNIPGYNEWQRLRLWDEKKEKKAEVIFNVENFLFYLTYCFLFNKEEVNEDKEKQELRIAEKLVHQAYTAGRLTLLIDALDEAPSKEIKESISACVKTLFTDLTEGPRKAKANRVFLTSRYSERETYFSGKGAEMLKPRFEVRSLDMEQLRDMARYFYGEETDLYKEFDDIVWREEIAARVGGTPIMALLVIAYYEIFRKFDTRYHMYNIIVIFILVRVWKQIKEKHFDKDMRIFFKEAKSKEFLKEEKNAREIYDALSLLSYEYMDKGTIINEEDIAGLFALFAREKVEEKEATAEAEQWLKQMKEDHLLVSAGANEYVFIHKTVMEYLAARYIVEKLTNPLYLEKYIENQDLPASMNEKGRLLIESETLPIAVGIDIQKGAALLRIIHDFIHKAENEEKKALLYRLALKCLAEWESFIDRQYRRTLLDLHHRKMEKDIADNRDAVDWIYKYMERIILTADKKELKEWLETFKNMPRLTRPYFFQEYLNYDKYCRGDSEIISLREELLYRAIDREPMDRWLGEHRKAEEKVLADKDTSLLTLDSAGYHPEDKNFRYYRNYSSKELAGFFGSPNFKQSDAVTCVAVSPDGKYIVSGSRDNTIKLWDAANGKEIRTFKGHSNKVTGVGFAPDGKTVLSGSADSTLKLWDAASGKEIRSFNGHEGGVNSVGFSPDGSRIISGSADSTLKLWDAASGKEIRSFTGHEGGINSVRFSPDGSRIISGSADSTLKLWDVETGKEIYSFSWDWNAVLSVDFSPDGSRIISGSADSPLKLWETSNGKEIHSFTGHEFSVTCVRFSPDGSRIISGSDDKSLKLWDAETGKEIRSFTGHEGGVNSVGFSPDGRRIISGSDDHSLKLWDAETGKEIHPFTGHKHSVINVGFSPDGSRIISGSADKTLKLWDAETGKEIRFFTGHRGIVLSVEFSPDGSRIISGSYDHSLKLWDMDTGKEIRSFTGHTNLVRSVGFSPDGSRIISGSDDKTLKLWDADTGKEIRTFKGHSDRVCGVEFSRDGRCIISGSRDNTIKLWNAESGKKIRSFIGHTGCVNSVGFSPDGSRIISGSSDKTLKLWDVDTGKEILSFTGHRDSVWSVEFSLNGNRIISGSSDKTLKIWDVEIGRCIKTIPLLWIPRDIKAMPGKPGVFAAANANGTITLFDFSKIKS